MTSSRLPGKHLLPACGKPMLMHLIERLKRVPLIDRIVIATTTNGTDDVLAALADLAGIEYYRGSENDVMKRVLEAGEAFKADIICEVTGDCPIIDPALVCHVIQTYLVNEVDYVNNGRNGLLGGMSAQVFSLAALQRSIAMTEDQLDREHVTLHFRKNPHIFRLMYLVAHPENHWPEVHLELDEMSDYVLLKRIIEHFGVSNSEFDCIDVIRLLRGNPDWLNINQHVMRRGDA